MTQSNNTKKILVITGTRAEYGLLKSTIDAIRQSKKLKLLLLVTGMHTLKKFGLTINEIKKDGIPISGVVKIKESDDMLSALAKEIVGISEFCRRNRPDMIIVLGDRDEAFAGAIAGSHLGIPVGHIHGGDFTGTIVDGLIRNAITKLSHLHFTACETSFDRVCGLGENTNNVFLVGAPGLDNIKKQDGISRKDLAQMLKIDDSRPWLLFLIHPSQFEATPLTTQIKSPLKAINKLINYEKIIIYPNADTGSGIFIKAIDHYKVDGSFHIFPSLSRPVYLSLLKQVGFLIGNSSSGIIESGYFKLPVINIGDRQRHRERGKNVIDSDYDISSITKAIRLATSQSFRTKTRKFVNPYGNGHAGNKIVKILEDIQEKNLVLNKTYI